MSPSAGFPTREVASLLGITEARLRTWVRSGFVRPGRGPGNRLRFKFQDLVVLRAAQALVDAGVPMRRVRRALERLRATLPVGRSLAELRIVAVGGEVVVEEGGKAWEPDSGQRLLLLDVGEMARNAAPLARALAVEAQGDAAQRTAEEWYELGLDLEATAVDEAQRAYLRAIELGPRQAAPYLNLGRLLHEQGDLAAAEELYRQALEHCEPEATAAFNLGVVLQDGERWTEAAEAYRCALELDPAYADAYYNLSAVYEELGDRTIALQNLQTYRRLTRGQAG
jgi:tetratricopeptide (TPR) repeat protein